ncbi:MAG: flavin reductase family protein [Phycisphaerales bacterium]
MAVESRADQRSAVLERVPWSVWIMTSAYEDQRAGALVRWVQRCADEPMLVSVAIKKCHSLEPLIRDSRGFALNLVSETDRLLLRKFDGRAAPDELTDAFESLAVESWTTGSPVLKRALAAIDCEVVRHLDLEADSEMFIGQVREARTISPG